MRAPALLLGLALVLLAPRAALAHLNDRQVHFPVNYFVLVPPEAGQTYLDPVFGTAVRRLSDAPHQPNSGDTGSLGFIVNEYSTMSPFNQDNSRLLLQHQSYFALYDQQGRYQQDLPFEIASSSEPRWSRHDPDLLYYLLGNSLKSYHVASGVRSVVQAFPEYTRLSGRGESDIGFDGDHLVLVGDDRDVFVYRLSTGTKGPVLDATGHPFDSVYLAPGEQVIVTWYQTGGGRFAGVELFDRDLNFQRQLAPAAGHMDVGRDRDGQPVLLWMNAADPQPPPDCQNAVVKIRLADGQRTCMLSLDWRLAVHVSAPDAGDWFFVSTYAPGDPAPVLGAWPVYAGEILQVRLDGSEVRRLAHHRSRPLNDYWYMPRAAVSRDGSRLVFSSNHGLPEVLGFGPEYVDAYLLDVASSTAAFPGSQSPVGARYEQDRPAVGYTGSWHPHAAPLHSQGSAVLAVDAGSRARFAFTGTAVRWSGYRDPWSGIARVYLDGQLRSTVDTFAAPAQDQAVLFTAADLAPGSHLLEVEATGTRGVASGGSWIWVDAFDALARVEQEAAAVAYTGSWSESLSPLHSGGRAVRALDAGARATFRFSGTAVSWIGYRDPSSGIALVSIDGVVRAEIDTWALASAAQAIVYTLDGLPAGEHTLTVEATGRAHPRSLGRWIWVDAFETTPE